MANKNEIQIEFKVINAEFQKAMKEMSGEVTKLNREFKLEQEQLRLNGTEKQKLESRVNYLSERYKLQQKEVKAVTEQLDKAKETFGENSKEVQNLENRLLEAQRKEAYFANELQSATKELDDQNNKLKQLGKSMQEFGGKMQEVGKKISSVGKDMTLKLTTPIMGIAGAASKLGIDFERSMSEVQAITGATGGELKELESTAREVGRTTNKSASEAAQGLKLLGQAGWDVTESQAELEHIVKMASSANIGLDKSASLAVGGLAVLGKSTNETESYFNLLTKAGNASNTNMEKMGEGFIQVGSRLTSLNIDMKDGAVALGILADAELEGAEAGRSLNAILTNLNARSGQAKDAMDALGVSAFDSNGQFKGIEQVMIEVDKAMEGMNDQQRDMYTNMISGKNHSAAFNALLDGTKGRFGELNAVVADTDGALDNMYKTITGDTKGSIENLKSAVEELGLKIYENLQPAIEKLVEWVQKVTDKFNNLSPKQQENIVNIGLLVAAIGPALLILGRLAGSIGNIIDVGGKLIGNWDKIKAAGSMLMGGLKATVGFIFSPAGAIVIGIVGVIAAGVALYKNWDTIKQKASQLGSFISNKFNQIKNWITSPIKSAIDLVSNQIDRLKGFFTNLKLTIPKPRLPKFSLSGKFSLMPPSVPKIGVKWNAEGAIFTRPTIFNTAQGLQGVGEKYNDMEAVLPISKLAGIINNIINKDRDLSGTVTNNKVINLNGNFEFRNQDDIDYFMEQAELRLLRGEI